MNKRWDGTERRTHLREQAEQRLSALPPAKDGRTAEELLHDLQVHQIELEMQNEALRQAQVDLEASRDRYVDLYEFAPVGYLSVTREGQIAEINLTGATLLGVERKQLTQRRFDRLVIPEDRERWQGLFVEAIKTEQRRDCELALQRGDGTPFQAHLDCLRMAAGDGSPVLRIALTDIDHIKQATLALAKSETRFRTLFESSADAIMLLDDNAFLDCNPATLKIFGCASHADFLGKHPAQLSPPSQPGGEDTRTLADRHIAAAFANGSERFEWWHCRLDGREFPAEVLLTALVLDGKALLQATVRDISDRHERELHIRDLNRILRTISACKEDMVRARSESELLGDTCRHIVEIGGYLLAWVAVSAPGGGSTPVAWHGSQTAYQAHCELDADPEHLSHCLVSAALSTQRSQICNRLNTMPERAFGKLSELGVQAALSLPLLNDGRLHGALTLFSIRPEAFDADEVHLMEELAADLAYGLAALRTTQERDRYLQRFEQAMQSIVTAMARTLEIRDPYTAGHQERVTRLAVAMAREMGLDETRIEGLKLGGMIHDIGKIAVPAEILAKPGRLSPLEYKLIQAHPNMGLQIVHDIEFPWPVAQMIVQHHERLDGNGYPAGLKGDEILLEARILAVADVVEAMSAHRPYRAGLGMEAALAEIEGGSGRLYDPAVVAACAKVVRENGMRLPE